MRSLSAVSDNTVLAYADDVAQFVTWAERVGLSSPAAVDRLVLRRYLAFLATRRFARRSIARKAAALRRYFAWLTRTGVLAADPSRRLSAPRGDGRLPHVLKPEELDALLAVDEGPPAVALAGLEELGRATLFESCRLERVHQHEGQPAAAQVVGEVDHVPVAGLQSVVAGAAALWLSRHPDATPAAVRAALVAAGSNDWDDRGDPDGIKEPLLDTSRF